MTLAHTFTHPLTNPQVIDQVNTYLAKTLASKFDGVHSLLDKASPKMAALLKGGMADSIASLKEMPGLMGYVKKAGELYTGRVNHMVMYAYTAGESCHVP